MRSTLIRNAFLTCCLLALLLATPACLRPAFAVETPAESQGWAFFREIRNANKEKQTVNTSLTYNGQVLSSGLTEIITPIGRFTWTISGITEDGAGYWTPWTPAMGDSGLLALKSDEAQTAFQSIGEHDLAAGFYKSDFSERLDKTPASWLYSVPHKCWLDPDKSEAVLKELGIGSNPMIPGILPESPLKSMIQPLNKPTNNREKTITRMKEVLDLVNQHGEEWIDHIREMDLLDSWGTPYQVIRLPEPEIAEKGYEYVIQSAGPDREFCILPEVSDCDDITIHDEPLADSTMPPAYKEMMENNASDVEPISFQLTQ